MSSIPTYPVNLDKEFLAACLAIPKQVRDWSPLSPTDRLVSPDASSSAARLTDKYPYAYSDFYGSGTPCVFKSGPDWRVRKGPLAQAIVREARPVYRHAIGRTWLSIGKRIYSGLDSIGVKWTSINPLAYADAGEALPFCSLILSIGVKPYSLTYDIAVAAANTVKQILAEAGFPAIEVAFVESVVARSVAAGPKFLSFDPLLDAVPELRKPFTTALGLSIAPLEHPNFEGTAALYFRLGKDDKRTAVLTCAHVARPPPIHQNTGYNNSQARAEIVALGNLGYQNALKAMMGTIGSLLRSIEVWNVALDRLGKPVEGENERVTERRTEHLDLVAKATKKIEEVNAIHDEVTKRRTIPDQRVLGFVLHSEKIEVSEVEPYNFTKDWALIELYDEKIDWSTFKGNKVYVGDNLSVNDFADTMFPQPVDRANYQYPLDGLLQAYGVVPDDEIRNPQHLDVHGEKCLLVVKNGLTTGTTVGRVNGLESFTRYYDDYDIAHTSIEIAVLPYDKTRGKFSAAGDSGSIVLARDGRIVGMLTGGAGATNETDITYLTPYWWLEQQIKGKYPGCFLYEDVQ